MKSKPLFDVKKAAELINGETEGDESAQIYNLDRIENAKAGDLTFYYDKKFKSHFDSLKAACAIVPKDCKEKPDGVSALIKVENPYLSFVAVLKYLDSLKPQKTSFRHKTAVISKSAEIADSAYIGPNCIIEENCVIGKNSVLRGNVHLYPNVKIGADTIIHSGVVCYQGTEIGVKCIIHAGAVIGSDGFGYVETKEGAYDKIPQIGNVVIKKNAEIGTNVTIDRAVVGSTIIGEGVKIDNLCQIAHNVELGDNTAMAAQVGISGSSKIGERNRLGGQVGIAGHLETAADVILEAQSGAAKSIKNKGIYFGSPSKDRMTAFRIEASLKSLPDLLKEVKKIKKALNLD